MKQAYLIPSLVVAICFSSPMAEGADMSVQLRTDDGSTKFSILNSTGGEVAYIDSLGRGSFSSILGFTFSGHINPVQINAGLLPAAVIASSVAVGSVTDTAIIGLSASKLIGAIPGNLIDISTRTVNPDQINPGLLPADVISSSVAVGSITDTAVATLSANKLTGTIDNARIDTSSITKLGNVFNGADQLLRLDGSGRLPAVSGELLTGVVAATLGGNISPTQITAGILPSNVIVSSVAVGSITDTAIATLTASKLTGTIDNARIDTSSITKLGNTFNSANQLLRLDGSGRLPAVSGELLTGVVASTLGGNINPSQINAGVLPANVIASSVAVGSITDTAVTALAASKLTGTIDNARIDTSSITKLGNTFNGADQLLRLDGSGRLPAVSGELLTGVVAATLGGNISPSQITAGALPSNVIASSAAVGSITDTAIATLTASKLTGTIDNARIDTSSITKLGNTFNSANQLLRLDGSGRLPAISGELLSGVTASGLSGTVNTSQINAGQLPSTVIASSVAVGAVTDTAIAALSASKLTGTIDNARIDTSSITKLGNTFNSSNQLVRLDGSGRLPALSGEFLTNVIAASLAGAINPNQMNAGLLPATVIASSVAVGSVTDAAITSLTASKLTGLIDNASIDTSSITKLGNTFNGANQLVKLDSAGKLLLGGGGTIARVITTTATLDFGAVGLMSCASLNVTVANSLDGDTVVLGLPKDLIASDPLVLMYGYVNTPGTVTIKRCNVLSLGGSLTNPDPMGVRVDVWQH